MSGNWILAPELRTKSFGIRIKGTECDGGWRYTEHEGRTAAFRGPADTEGNVKVHLQLRVARTIEIPARFLVPIKPVKEVDVKKAVLIFGEDVGSEVEVTNTEDDDWTVWNLSTSSFIVCSSNHLAALVPGMEIGATLITKPPGEAGRPARGYTLRNEVPWDDHTYTQVQVCSIFIILAVPPLSFQFADLLARFG
jgi:hypothetical protein